MSEGCGRFSVTVSTGFSAETYTYDQATGELIGKTERNDQAEWECGTNVVHYGTGELPCEEAMTCTPCGGEHPSELSLCD